MDSDERVAAVNEIFFDTVFFGSAVIQGNYRYSLVRHWGEGARLISCMLNPSTADANKNDPTLLRNIHFAKLWGFKSLEVINLFAWRSPKPKALLEAKDPIGPMNDQMIYTVLSRGDAYLVAWGNSPSRQLESRINKVEKRILEVAKTRGVPVFCLGRTMNGSPKHPLARGVHRVPDNQQPILYTV